jgi:hypothetical protein
LKRNRGWGNRVGTGVTYRPGGIGVAEMEEPLVIGKAAN